MRKTFGDLAGRVTVNLQNGCPFALLSRLGPCEEPMSRLPSRHLRQCHGIGTGRVSQPVGGVARGVPHGLGDIALLCRPCGIGKLREDGPGKIRIGLGNEVIQRNIGVLGEPRRGRMAGLDRPPKWPSSWANDPVKPWIACLLAV